jgi:hypothetical protein
MYGEKFEPVQTIEPKDSVIESGLIEINYVSENKKSKNLFEDYKTTPLESK